MAGVVNMKEKYLKIICLVLIVINTIAMFLLIGMPKTHTNRLHFTDDIIRPHNDKITVPGSPEAVYSPLQDIELTDNNGNKVFLFKGTRIAAGVYYENSLDGKNIERFSVSLLDPPYTSLDIKKEDLYDFSKFEDVTEKVRQEEKELYDRQIEEGHKKFDRYMFKERFWFLYPVEYGGYYILGLIPALMVFALWFSIYKRNKYMLVTISLIILSAVKIAGIVYYYAHPTFCR